MQLSCMQMGQSSMRHLPWSITTIANIKATMDECDNKLYSKPVKMLYIQPSVQCYLYGYRLVFKKEILYILQ